ncbi:MAG: rhomboid family intramembrane serine protease, partial [Bacteroidota bacterium]
EYEEIQGPHRLLAAYLIGGLGGAFLTILFYNIFPGAVAVHGASAAVLGVMMAVAITYPYKSIGLLFIGTVRLIYVVIGFLVLDILFIAGSRTAVTAHLGGALFGYLFARAEASGRDLSSWTLFLLGEKPPSRRSRGRRRKRNGFFERVGSWLGGQEPEEGRIAGRIGRESPSDTESVPAQDGDIDRILDKISESGYESLTDEEKRTLYDASKR